MREFEKEQRRGIKISFRIYCQLKYRQSVPPVLITKFRASFIVTPFFEAPSVAQGTKSQILQFSHNRLRVPQIDDLAADCVALSLPMVLAWYF